MNFKAWQRQSGMTYERIAAALRVDKNTVSRWANGVHTPGTEMIILIEEFTNGAVTFYDWYKRSQAHPAASVEAPSHPEAQP